MFDPLTEIPEKLSSDHFVPTVRENCGESRRNVLDVPAAVVLYSTRLASSLAGTALRSSILPQVAPREELVPPDLGEGAGEGAGEVSAGYVIVQKLTWSEV